MRRSDVITAVGLTVAAGALGSVASGTGTSSRWYTSLRKPSFQPPAVAFPVVWTALYASIIGASVAAQAATDDAGRASYRRALAANMALNAAWPWAFFRFHRLGPAAVVAAALAASSGDLARRAGAARPAAGAALVPYVVWTVFATVLTVTIRRLNPSR
jgi:tryptophan-rich sensory protein